MYDVWYASVVATHDFLAESDLIEISVLVRRDYLPNHSFLVGMDGEDRVVGFMGMTGQEIDSLFIDPAYRGKGLGRALVAVAASKTTGLEVEVNAQNPAGDRILSGAWLSCYFFVAGGRLRPPISNSENAAPRIQRTRVTTIF
jgi:GNAT superfamily N-acetyltransferase